MSGLVIILSGPSCAGKGSLAKGSGLPLAASYTTRPPKPRDKPGEYIYVSEQGFKVAWQANKMLEHSQHFDSLYGLAKPKPNDVLITDIDVDGALKLKNRSGVILIGVLPPDPIVDVCLKRLRARGDETEEEILARIDRIRYESELILEHWPRIIRNENLLDAQHQLKVIIANSCKKRGIIYP